MTRIFPLFKNSINHSYRNPPTRYRTHIGHSNVQREYIGSCLITDVEQISEEIMVAQSIDLPYMYLNPLVINSAIRSPFLSRSAFVATVVPIRIQAIWSARHQLIREFHQLSFSCSADV